VATGGYSAAGTVVGQTLASVETFVINDGIGANFLVSLGAKTYTTAQDYVNEINSSLTSSADSTKAHAIVTGTNSDKIQILSLFTGTTSNITFGADINGVLGGMGFAAGAGTAGLGEAVATYVHLQAGVAGAAGNNDFMASSDLHGPALVHITAGTYGDNTGTTIQRAVNNALVSANLLDSATAPTAGIVATLDGLGNLDLTSTTVGALSAVQLTDPPTANGSVNTALAAGALGIAVGMHTGGSATAASLQSTIQSAIDTATGTG
jgi:hypothetical protein